MDFDWDFANMEHIARHKVEPDEAEEAARDPDALPMHTIHRGPQGQPRYGLLGTTESGRLLYIVLEQRLGRARVVTARPATAEERQQYDTEE
ncbi:BrnT family toxin [Deinococcus koreensis]|uniref:BrnT family toxin n=1 Tax=Deinococcus koreensis TaxID=2054903 RepID=A0A2K3UW06_9DEIO|nr:BrnT family toxin [Deinococcus koreensis]PNY80723.1 BrnT family toxin [Deinococcus koreensis]